MGRFVSARGRAAEADSQLLTESVLLSCFGGGKSPLGECFWHQDLAAALAHSLPPAQ